MKINKDYWKRTSSYVALGTLLLPTIILYIPMLSGFGIPPATLELIQAIGAVMIVVAQVFSFKQKQNI